MRSNGNMDFSHSNTAFSSYQRGVAIMVTTRSFAHSYQSTWNGCKQHPEHLSLKNYNATYMYIRAFPTERRQNTASLCFFRAPRHSNNKTASFWTFRRIFSNEEWEEMVFFFVIDFRAFKPHLNSMAPANNRSLRPILSNLEVPQESNRQFGVRSHLQLYLSSKRCNSMTR